MYHRFYVHGTVHCNSMSINVQQDATIHSLFYLQTAPHVSGGLSTHHQVHQITVSTASGISQVETQLLHDSDR